MPSDTFLTPRIINVENISPLHAKVTMEPFERGYGHTLGNAIRRVLLSSMPGFAPTEVQIGGVVHEYSALDGVEEDVVDILLNLKGIVLKLHNATEAVLILKKDGEGVATAGDIEAGHDVEIINPEHVIAHLTAGGKVDMQIKIEILTKKDCCLCDDAKEIIERVLPDFPATLTMIDIESDPDLFESYKERIPVVRINGKESFVFKVHETTLRKKIEELIKER